MGVMANRRSMMILFSSASEPRSHCARLVLAEKNISFDVVDVDDEGRRAELAGINAYGNVPTLVDRDLVAYEVRIICEYIDERFPHPPLMPVDPVSRATSRIGFHRIFSDWYSLLPGVESEDRKQAAQAKKMLRDTIASSADIFALKPFFMGDDMTLVDCAIAPILWRLPHYRISLPRQARIVEQYADRVFGRESFQSSLTEIEKDMRF